MSFDIEKLIFKLLASPVLTFNYFLGSTSAISLFLVVLIVAISAINLITCLFVFTILLVQCIDETQPHRTVQQLPLLLYFVA